MKLATALAVYMALTTGSPEWTAVTVWLGLWALHRVGDQWLEERERLVAARKPWPDVEDISEPKEAQ